MSLDEVLQHALDHHPILRARQHEVEAARARLVTAGLLPNPQLVLDTRTQVEDEGRTALTTRVMFTIPTGRKRRLRQAAAEAAIQRTRCALAREIELVLAEAADAALEVLYLQELLGLESELAELAVKTAEIEKGRFKAAALPYLAARRSELDAARLELARRGTEGRLELARIRLGRAIGLRPLNPIRLRGKLAFRPVPAVPLDRLLAAAQQSRPELAESRAALLESQQQVAVARAEARPDIGFGPRFRDVLGATGDVVGARISLDVPLFDRNQGRIAEAAALARTQSAMLDVAEIGSLSDVASMYAELCAAQSRLDFYQVHVEPMLAEIEETIRQGGAERVLDPGRTAELLEQLVRMRLEYLDLRYLHARLRMKLEILLGESLDQFAGGG